MPASAQTPCSDGMLTPEADAAHWAYRGTRGPLHRGVCKMLIHLHLLQAGTTLSV